MQKKRSKVLERIGMLHILQITLFIVVIPLFADNIKSKFIQSAREQVGKTLYYDPSYQKLSYPNGDIPIVKGVCTDVVVRALRGVGIDMQKRVYQDRVKHPQRYKGLYHSQKADKNIDHRRVKNLQKYFEAKGYRVKDRFKAGDIVVWKLPNSNLDHIGICSDRLNSSGEPLIIHNVGAGAKEEDVLRDYIIVDHFRIFK